LILVFVAPVIAPAQKPPVNFTDGNGQLKYSLLDNWYSRKLKESSLLSGNTIELYGVGKVSAQADFTDLKLKDNSSPWATTNIYAKMVLDVGNTRVIPEKRGDGYCARLETKIRKDNIAGFKVDVLLAGTLFLGETAEPVKGMKDPEKNASQGIPFTGMPKAVKFDYKYHIGKSRIMATTNVKPVAGEDRADFAILLQKRWEDKDGNVFATRIGGNRLFFTGTEKQWINGASFPVYYGDATHLPQYDPKTMGLVPAVGRVFVKNSKGIMVPLVETGWGKPGETPTHLIMYFTSSYEGMKYTGSTESVLWVDNIELIY
jgi:Putative carbohydrate metabolism domain